MVAVAADGETWHRGPGPVTQSELPEPSHFNMPVSLPSVHSDGCYAHLRLPISTLSSRIHQLHKIIIPSAHQSPPGLDSAGWQNNRLEECAVESVTIPQSFTHDRSGLIKAIRLFLFEEAVMSRLTIRDLCVAPTPGLLGRGCETTSDASEDSPAGLKQGPVFTLRGRSQRTFIESLLPQYKLINEAENHDTGVNGSNISFVNDILQ
ncbi:hypothetical protein EYF80_006638 [Liparis tanakae]|uniref:Uncharacterized protein n=1 Tax=Liparis tanakae TaxID=230148 RepID=A0A4Z2IZ14_9TELE|nr:hypothetical protein EYF80_006638 [Liparis tanakae]